jgi:hypothetical protein
MTAHNGAPGSNNTDVRFFIRDDDIGELTDALRAFVAVFVARRLPVSYQIIPARLSNDCASFLLDTARDHPDLIEVGQHGLAHQMMLRGKVLKREFGPERDLAAQSADIAQGAKMLRERLGAVWPIDIFTPPQHKFDGNTVRAAAAAGHRIFSAARYPTPHHRLAYAAGGLLRLSSIFHHGISYHDGPRPEAEMREVSIAIAVDDGRERLLGARDIAGAMKKAARHTRTVGLMFHHALYETAADQADLAAIADALTGWGPENFSQLGALARDG